MVLECWYTDVMFERISYVEISVGVVGWSRNSCICRPMCKMCKAVSGWQWTSASKLKTNKFIGKHENQLKSIISHGYYLDIDLQLHSIFADLHQMDPKLDTLLHFYRLPVSFPMIFDDLDLVWSGAAAPSRNGKNSCFFPLQLTGCEVIVKREWSHGWSLVLNMLGSGVWSRAGI